MESALSDRDRSASHDRRPTSPRSARAPSRWLGWTSIIAGALLALAAGGSSLALAEDDSELDRRITKLINQLGDNEYVVRQRAQQELARLGFAAFDALTDAEENDDVEIATQARYLARQIRSDWLDETVPPQVRTILKDYEFVNEPIRLNKMKLLLQLQAEEGVEWLCRVLRFEQSPVLAKEVAILIITQDPQPDDASWPKRAATLTKNLDRSRRPAARWLRTYVEMRSDPEKALANWIELVEEEKRTLEQHPQQSDSGVLMKLLKIEVAQLQRLKRDDEALAAMHQMVAIEHGEPQSLAELVGWLAKRRAWSVIDEVATRFAANFEDDPQLLYTLAQALAAEGKTDKANEAADRALHLNPDRAEDHRVLAFVLQHRGLTDWSDREFRYVIDMKGTSLDAQVIALRARFGLAESLHDRSLDREAGEVMQGAVEQLDNNAKLAEHAAQPPTRVEKELHRAQMYFYQASSARQKLDFATQRELLEKAVQADANNADVLIALYRLPDQSTEQRQKTMELITSSVNLCRNLIDEDPDKSGYYNQLAWLVANTEGDFDDAIRLSEKSVELERATLARETTVQNEAWLIDREERLGGQLDTLAHCYAAKGNYAAAVKTQAEANRLMPHSQTVANKLAFFRSKLPTTEQKDAP